MTVLCPVCASADFAPFFRLDNVPVQDGLLWPTQAAARISPTGNIELAYCGACGYVSNTAFDSGQIRYDQDYSFSLHYSPVYQSFVHELARRLVTEYSLRDKAVLEIGCGRADFLRLLREQGVGRAIGIDPSIKPAEIAQAESEAIVLVRDAYSDRHSKLDSDFVCCRHLLNHIADPAGFLRLLRQNLGARRDAVIYMEVPDGAYTFGQLRLWNIIYERCSWFSPLSIANLFRVCGFEVLSAKPCYLDGQYLGLEARPAELLPRDRVLSQLVEPEMAEELYRFARSVNQTRADWQRQLEHLADRSQRALAWGAGASAISFLTMLQVVDQIPYVVDVNPLRQGQFLPLTGQMVVSPQFILDYKPDVIIVTNPSYEQEIKRQVAELGYACRFLSL